MSNKIPTGGLTSVIRAVTIDPTIRIWRARSGFVCVIFQGLVILGELFVVHTQLMGWRRILIVMAPGLLALALLAPEMFRLVAQRIPGRKP